MSKIILSINAGSSSVKISVFSTTQDSSPRQLAEAQITGMAGPGARLNYSRGGEAVSDRRVAAATAEATEFFETRRHDGAFKILLDLLVDDPALPELGSRIDVAIAAHRIVHGGDYGTHQIMTADTFCALEELNDLAPLHNACSLDIVRTCSRRLPGAVNVAHFDTQFHASIPAHVYTYPICPFVARKNRLRKYGFHGISYAFILRAAAEALGKDPSRTSLIALHLGSGASACAIRDGKSWDTSMGLTPLAGLPGATRSGSVDPSLVFHYAIDVGKLSTNSTKDLHISQAEEILNTESGWRALTGTTNFGNIAAAAAAEDEKLEEEAESTTTTTNAAEKTSKQQQHNSNYYNYNMKRKTGDKKADMKLVFDMFVDRVCGFVGSYYVALGGKVDALVFSGGIGERSAKLRREVTRQASCLGFELDDEKNERGPGAAAGEAAGAGAAPASPITDITGEGARHKTLVCLTDEQLEMARVCAEDPELWG